MKKLLSVFFLFLTISGFSQSLATYNFTGATGDQPSQPVTSTNTNITASDITRGSSLTANPGANSFNSKGWVGASLDPTKYYEFTLTPNSGYIIRPSSLSLIVQRSSTGPTNYSLTASVGGGAETTLSSDVLTGTSNITINPSTTISTPQSIRFRLYAWGASSSAGTLRLNNTVTVFGSAPLPVKLLSFTGESANKAVVLNWATAWEEKNEGFDILKGSSATSLESVGFVAGKTTTQELSSYSFTDTDVKDGQVYYYQLRQKDVGGGSELSKIIAVRARSGAEESASVVYPNPNRGSFSVSARDISAVSLFNSAGIEIPVSSSKVAGAGTMTIEATTPLPTGMYHLRLQAADGTYKQSIKVIVQ